MDLLVKDEEEEFKEAEISESEDEIQDADEDRKRGKLIDSVLALNNKNAKYSQRTIRAKEITEFNFGSSDSFSKVRVGELLQSLAKVQKNKKIKKQLKRIQKTDLLEKPLPKHEQEKLDRTTAYQKVSEEVSVWNSAVWENRKKEHQEFPLQSEKIEVFNNQTFCKRFVARNPLELEIQALLRKGGSTEKKDKVLTPIEEQVLKAMDVGEAKRRRSDLMKYKALLNYQELKAKWKGKIKSKNYRRRLKKERLEKEKTSIHELAEKDPEMFEEKMKSVEKSRVKERASLKHRGGSKFQKKQMLYAKYDPNTRERIAEMVRKNKELTKKSVQITEESSDESDISEDERPAKTISGSGSSNSWMGQKNAATKTPVRIQLVPKAITANKQQEEESLVEADNIELITEEVMPTSLREPMPGKNKVVAPLVPEKEESYIDAEQVLSTNSNISTSIPMLLVDEESGAEEDNDGDKNDKIALSQAFADDDVVQAFSEEKHKTVDNENPKDIDLSLPGWGSWFGNGLKVPTKKRKRFTIKAGCKKRKDERLGHVILNEKSDKAISSLLVKEVPFPFIDAKDFSRSIRAPIGKEWNAQTAVNKLIQPKITTKSGTIIKPIDRSILLKQDKEFK